MLLNQLLLSAKPENNVIWTLVLAGIVAGLIQYYVDWKKLEIYSGAPQAADPGPHIAGLENPAPANVVKLPMWVEQWILFLKRTIKFLSVHWRPVGYIVVGIGGAFLAPVADSLLDGKLFRKGSQLAFYLTGKEGIIGSYVLFLAFGYGIIFGYSAVRILRGMGTWFSSGLPSALDRQQKMLTALGKEQEAIGQKADAATKEAAQAKEVAKMAQANAAANHQSAAVLHNAVVQLMAPPVSTYFDEASNNEEKAIFYKSLNLGADPGKLFSDMHDLLEKTHKTHLPYKPASHLYPVVDIRPDSKVQSIYSGKDFTVRELSLMDEAVDAQRGRLRKQLSEMPGLQKVDASMIALQASSTIPYNCEHVVPQSWFNHLAPMVGDLHHLFACEMKCNGFRGNNCYGEFDDYGIMALDGIMDECGKLEGGVFEPYRNKGLVARATLYFLVRYPQKLTSGRPVRLKDVQTLLEWHRTDPPVSQYELHRNQQIFYSQGNRNPFIDHPELAEKMDFAGAFGAQLQETDVLSNGDSVTAAISPDDQNRCISGSDSSTAIAESLSWDLTEAASCVSKGPPYDIPWRVAASLLKLREKINMLAPLRSKKSDGTIGDSAHQGRNSDHNPWVKDGDLDKGVVTAMDITHDPGDCDCHKLAASLQTGKDKRIKYLIWNRQIMSSSQLGNNAAWTWRPYSGTTPHTAHIHISVHCDAARREDNTDWDVSVG